MLSGNKRAMQLGIGEPFQSLSHQVWLSAFYIPISYCSLDEQCYLVAIDAGVRFKMGEKWEGVLAGFRNPCGCSNGRK